MATWSQCVLIPPQPLWRSILLITPHFSHSSHVGLLGVLWLYEVYSNVRPCAIAAPFAQNSFPPESSPVNSLPSFKAYLLNEALPHYSFKLQTANPGHPHSTIPDPPHPALLFSFSIGLITFWSYAVNYSSSRKHSSLPLLLPILPIWIENSFPPTEGKSKSSETAEIIFSKEKFRLLCILIFVVATQVYTFVKAQPTVQFKWI